ncbi:MAG: DUF4837 family protein [Bacteroidaceae bacterium]|nr:DUF4837 family protein [Bacteroidaceae bacterium]
MKNYIRLLLVFVSTSLLFVSCENKEGKKSYGSRSTVQSAPYELLVVANRTWLDNTSAGVCLMDVVKTPIEGLPQEEPNFRVTTLNPSGFNNTFKVYGNIIFAEVSPKYKKAEMSVSRDEYCHPQVILKISAPDDASFVSIVKSNSEMILDMFNKQEFSRERTYLNSKYSGKVFDQAKKQFGVTINVPQDVDEIKQGKDFFWSSSSKQLFRLNVCMYALPMSDLSLEEFVALRDSVMKINIPGEREDQWMETDSRTVTNKIVNLDKRSVVSVRGLWDMKNDAFGGPFVSYLYADTLKNRILVAEGFVMAPEEKKRPLVRQLEAALQTVTFE